MVPGFRVFIATLVVPFQVPERGIKQGDHKRGRMEPNVFVEGLLFLSQLVGFSKKRLVFSLLCNQPC